MLRWCQNVSVYNIENHYHFYNDHEPRSRALSSVASEKLKAGAIQVNSTINSKKNSKSCLKKGLRLSKMLKNPEEGLSKFKIMDQFRKQYSSTGLNQHARSITDSLNDIAKTRSMESENMSKQFTVIYNKAEINQSNQQLLPKPKLQVPVLDFKQQNNLLLTNLYSTQSSKNKRYTKTNKISQLLTPNRYIANSQIASSRINNQKHQSKSQLQLSQSMDGKNSRYNTNRSVSGFNDQRLENSNDRVYFRILQMSRGEAREASIILSNILSRSAHNSYCQAKARKVQKSNQKRINLQDKLTILSQNDAQSQSSIKVQESQLYQSDPKNNFTLLDKSLKASTYTINLAIQNSLHCIVSLKQIGFRQMSAISQQLQMYEFLQQNIGKSDTYRNILELYQVQMANGSYLLIKQPFTNSPIEYLKQKQKIQVDKFFSELQQTVKNLLFQLSHHQIFATRLLTLKDFVLCQTVIKLHDMSIFKQMKSVSIETDRIIKQLMNFSQFEQGMEC